MRYKCDSCGQFCKRLNPVWYPGDHSIDHEECDRCYHGEEQ